MNAMNSVFSVQVIQMFTYLTKNNDNVCIESSLQFPNHFPKKFSNYSSVFVDLI